MEIISEGVLGGRHMTTQVFGYGKLDQPEVLQALFHPRPEMEGTAPPEAVDYEIPVQKGVSLGARFYMGGTEDPNILFFHGNGEIVADYDPIGPLYNDHGLSLLAVDYRGYGRSGGTPTATALMGDGHIVFAEVRRWLEGEGRKGPLVVMGRSLGSACALDLAACYTEVSALVIESGFVHTIPLLRCLGVDTQSLGITEANGFKNLQKISQISKPTLIMHARYDQLIPAMSAELLQVHCAARNKEFHMIPGADHNTIMVHAGEQYFAIIKRFMNKVEGKRPREKHYFRNRRRRKTETIH
jgi:hypothetical protein